VSKPTENVLLVPGEDGWEIWTGESASGFTFQSATGLGRAGDIPSLPPGDLTMLFPVRSLTALPMQAPGHDESLFPDLAAMHAERLGLRPDPMAGQLTDIFVVSAGTEHTCLLSVILRNPADGDLPVRGPKEFELSARALPLAGDSLYIWREFGRWVFAISQAGNLVYCQATACTSPAPDNSLVREIRLAMIQLSLQGIDLHPAIVVLWTSAPDAGPAALAGAFGVRVDVAPRPAPLLPATRSKLLPADVRAARREALQRRNTRAAIAAVALAYLGALGWFGFGLWQDASATKLLKAQAADAAPAGREYQEHIEKWDELANAIDLNYSPVDILMRVHRSIPINSGLRLRTAEINAGEIKLIGEAPQLPAVNQFNRNLKQNNDLARFEWQTPEPQQTNRGWEFVYTANLPQS
jgi:hypothetical protein